MLVKEVAYRLTVVSFIRTSTTMYNLQPAAPITLHLPKSNIPTALKAPKTATLDAPCPWDNPKAQKGAAPGALCQWITPKAEKLKPLGARKSKAARVLTLES
mmetsp:Transcript_21838/g.60682  ORF Transcript_21838/g.60682 Transcript_21838/m.60682 type:complete len:102 (-) Transcript_21838:7449-7754(-)